MTADSSPRALLTAMFDAAIASAQPAVCMPPHLPRRRAAGSSSSAPARLGRHGAGRGAPLAGSAVGPRRDPLRLWRALQRIEIVEAAHPVPDAAGHARGASACSRWCRDLSAGRSGAVPDFRRRLGAAAAAGAGLTLDLKQSLSRALLASGATISEINCVRRHLSGIKGGRLGGGVPSGAGADAADFRRARATGPSTSPRARRWPIRPPARTRWHSAALWHRRAAGGARSARERPRRIGEAGRSAPRARRARMIATPQMALEAAAALARAAGYHAAHPRRRHRGRGARRGQGVRRHRAQVADRAQPFAAPCVLLSGGETTVTVRGNGRGGRNVEFLLSLAIALDGHARIHALAGRHRRRRRAGGDRRRRDRARTTLARAWRWGLSPKDVLANNDAHTFLQALGDSVVTGPTLTNVNDFRAILIEASR